MTTQPSDWAVARAYWEASDKLFDTKEDERFFPILIAISERARELDASGEEAPDVAVQAFWNTLGETGDYDSAIKAAINATPRAAAAGDWLPIESAPRDGTRIIPRPSSRRR